MLKAIIFDLNGVLIQSKLLSTRIQEKYRVPEEKFIPVLKKVMVLARKPGHTDTFSLWEPHLKELGLNTTREEFFNFWFSGESVNTPALEFIQELREKGIKVFILSNNFSERTTFYRNHFPEIFNSVDNAYFSWETGYVKPDKEAYLSILAQNQLDPANCLYFDDTEKNLEVAKG